MVNMYLSSDEALTIEELPKSIIIVGGGVIGIEWASMLSDFDVEVTVVEYADGIVPTEDQEISKEMQRLMKKKGVKLLQVRKFFLKHFEKGKGEVSIKAEHKGEEKSFTLKKSLFL